MDKMPPPVEGHQRQSPGLWPGSWGTVDRTGIVWEVRVSYPDQAGEGIGQAMKQMVGKAGLELRAHIEKIGLSAKPDAKKPTQATQAAITEIP